MKKELICIRCPKGCRMTVTGNEDETLTVTGNTCRRGEEYALQEVTNPMRIVTTVVRVKNGRQPVVSVKTNGDIPKGKMMECIELLKDVELEAPVRIGDVVYRNAAGTGVDIVVTKDVSQNIDGTEG